MPQSLSTENETASPSKRIILLMGLRSSGKTSIVDFVFKKTPPTDTLYIESTRKPNTTDFTAFANFQVWDLPGNTWQPPSEVPMDAVGAVIYIIDGQASQNESTELARKVASSMLQLHAASPSIVFEVFVHKTDGMSDEYQSDLLEDIRQHLLDEMQELPESPPSGYLPDLPIVSYYLTSIYDHSIYEALSKITQKLLPCQAAVERMMDLVCQSSGMEKAFLFHLPTKLYVGTDSSPVDSKTHEICSDFVDLCVDFGGLYSPEQPAITATSNESDSGSILDSPLRTATPLPGSATLAPQARHPATSKVKLTSGVTLAHWDIDERLSLVGLLQPNKLDKQAALIEYNIGRFRESILKIHALEQTHAQQQ